MEKAIACDSDNVITGCEAIYLFLKQQGRLEEAKIYQERAEKHYLLIRAKQERSCISDRDTFLPHNLPLNTIRILGKKIAEYEQILEVYLAQKKLKFFPKKLFI